MGDLIRVRVGETFGVKLEGNATTGFRWEFAPQAANTGVVALSRATYEAGTGAVGSPGLHTFEFMTLSAGSTELKFSYRRSWEATEPRSSKTILVEVRE